MEYAEQADDFHRQTYTNPDSDGLFWQAAALLHLKKVNQARKKAQELAGFNPGYPLLSKLQETIKKAETKL